MKCRVHYQNPQGRPAFKDVVAPTKEEAVRLFAHLYPGVRKIDRAEMLGQPAVRPANRPPVPRGTPATDAQLKAVASGLRDFRRKLAAS